MNCCHNYFFYIYGYECHNRDKINNSITSITSGSDRWICTNIWEYRDISAWRKKYFYKNPFRQFLPKPTHKRTNKVIICQKYLICLLKPYLEESRYVKFSVITPNFTINKNVGKLKNSTELKKILQQIKTFQEIFYIITNRIQF